MDINDSPPDEPLEGKVASPVELLAFSRVTASPSVGTGVEVEGPASEAGLWLVR